MTIKTSDICAGCAAVEDLWVVNPDGGYGRAAVSACTACLRGPLGDLVPRLLDVYPAEDADALRRALADSRKNATNSRKRDVGRL